MNKPQNQGMQEVLLHDIREFSDMVSITEGKMAGNRRLNFKSFI